MQKYVTYQTIEPLFKNLRVIEFGTNRENGGTKIVFQTLEGYKLIVTESVDCATGGSIIIKNGDTNLDNTVFTFNDEEGLFESMDTALVTLGYGRVTFDFSDVFMNQLVKSLLYLGLAKEQVILHNSSSVSLIETNLLLTAHMDKPESFITITEVKPEFNPSGINYTMTLVYGQGDERTVIEKASFGSLNNLLITLVLESQGGKLC